MATAALEAFVRDHIPPTPRDPADHKAGRVLADGDMPIDFDTLIYILIWAWRTCAKAPRLAAVAQSWAAASTDAEKAVRCEDVVVPRSRITRPWLPPLEPTLSFTEQTVTASWGKGFESYTAVVVQMPAAGDHMQCPYEFDDFFTTVRIGRFLNSVTVNAFLGTIMPDMYTAARIGSRVTNFFIPTCFSDVIMDGRLDHAVHYVKNAYDNADYVHITIHYAGTDRVFEHWVHVRVNKAVYKVEIFEPANLVRSAHIGHNMLRALVTAGALSSTDGWTVVLYNKQVHGMPRQSDGSSCGVFACVVALHLVAGRRLPRNIQDRIQQWRMYIAMKVWGAGTQVLE